MSAIREQYDAAMSGYKLLGFVAVTILGTVLWAYTIHALYGWFVLPLGAPPIGMAHAFGLYWLAKALAWGYADVAIACETRDEGLKRLVYSGITMPLGALGVGYVVAHWIGI